MFFLTTRTNFNIPSHFKNNICIDFVEKALIQILVVIYCLIYLFLIE